MVHKEFSILGNIFTIYSDLHYKCIIAIGKDLDLHYSTLLSRESLLSILEALEAKTAGTFTLNLGQENLDKLTAQEKALATDKGWTLL